MAYAPGRREGQGWLTFASIVLVTAGIMRIFDAFWAFDKHDELSDTLENLLFDQNLNTYGVIWLVVGVLLVLAGFGVLAGAQWARWFGIVMAAIAMISSFLWIYAYPIWSLVGVLIAMSVVYALSTYGDAMEPEGPDAGDVR